jgi:hypothetical protein
MKRAFYLLPLALLFSLSFGAVNLQCQTALADKERKTTAECALTVRDAPELFGMRLGMSLDETKAVAPNLGLSRRIRKANGISTSLSSKPNEEAEGVVNSYLDDKLFEIDVLYNSANKWNDTLEFIQEFSRKFNLPNQAWTKVMGSQNYLLICQGFTVEARDQNHIVLSDTMAGAENRKRAEETAILNGKN